MRHRLPWWFSAGLGLALALGVPAGAQETPAADPESTYAKLADSGPGIYEVKVDKKGGRVVSLLAVGQARIPEVLRDAKGMELVRRRAQLSAFGGFIAWLKEDVKLHDEKGTERVSKSAEADLSDLQNLELVYQRADTKEKTYTVVFRWARAK